MDGLAVTDRETEHPAQDKLIQSEKDADFLSDSEYKRLEDRVTAAGGEHGIDQVLRENNVDVILGPADSRLPDVTALASRSPNVGIGMASRLTFSRRIPFVDTAAWVPRLERQTLRDTSSCFSIPGGASARRCPLVGSYLSTKTESPVIRT